MPAASVTVLSATASVSPTSRKSSLPPERKYKCQFCNRAFSRSEHRSRHERSHTKERPFKCNKCRSTFVRRDLLLRHDRTVHAKDGGIPLHSDNKRRAGPKQRGATSSNSPSSENARLLCDQTEAHDDVLERQTAAMLVAVHEKTAGETRDSASPYQGTSPLAYSPHSSTVLDNSTPYQPNVATISSSMAWEPLIPASASESKAASVSSSVSESYDRAPSFQDNVAPPSRGGLNQLGATNLSGPAAALQSLSRSVPSSIIGTPRISSPLVPAFASTAATHSGRHVLPSASRVAASSGCATDPHVGFTVPQVSSVEERGIINDNIYRHDSENSLPEGYQLPQLSSLNRYLSTYFKLFHRHLPFLHPASFAPTLAPPPLLLAVLSIGSLYSFEQEQAYMLHIGSKVLVNQFLQNKENFSSRRCPLWTMQSSLLNMIFASWSGDAKGLEWACSIKSLLANMVAGNRYELKLRQEARHLQQPTQTEWIEDEGCRRTYYAVYIFFGLLTLTYNHTPAISFNEFEDLQLPSDEVVWNAQMADEEDWREQLGRSAVFMFMEAHGKLFEGQTLKYSAFATRVMINALFLEVWYHKRSPEALQDVVTEYKLRLALDTWESSLTLCEPDASTMVHFGSPRTGQPLLFNAMAMYRNARARLEVDLKSVQEALRYHDPYEVAAAMSNARDRVKRSSQMIKVIQECYNCLETVVRQGVRWVARTSPTNWSVEHPLCGMDLVIILSLWLYRLEHDEDQATQEELDMYNKIRLLLVQDHEESYDSALSSIVARLWGSMLDVVVVWGYVHYYLYISPYFWLIY
jgi:DNA-directed RNA polymerase subunit RPC12/RpoP